MQTHFIRPLLPLALLPLIVVFCGCSGGPAPPDQPGLDASSASAKAMEIYDKNSDNQLDAEERQASPALELAMETMDENNDGMLGRAEIKQRIEEWQNADTIINTQGVEVYRNGQPVEGATVTLVPEEFLQPTIQVTQGTTNADGFALPEGQDAQYPGIYLGLYRVKISKQQDGRETIPPRFNSETTLAIEVAPDAPSTQRLFIFDVGQ